MDDLLADFLTETNESLAELDVALLTLERTPDDADTLALIFRMVHTIKGTCGFLGLPRLERVAHAGENVLGKVRDRSLAATPDIVSIVLTALDRIKAIVAGLAATGIEPAGDDVPLIDALNATAAGHSPVREPAVAEAALKVEVPPPAALPPPATTIDTEPAALPPVAQQTGPAPAPTPAAAEPPHAAETNGKKWLRRGAPPATPRPSGSPSTCWKIS
jgi:two-component system chemotaxis sensor kinase CheA